MDALLLDKLVLPLCRLVATMCLGLALAGLLENLHWTHMVARLVSPLARIGHLGETAAASFALAFFSPSASNALLSEAHAKGQISKRELIFANLFNSSPTFLVHLPTLFSLVFAFLGVKALLYVGLSFLAATLRTLGTVLAGRLLLPKSLNKIGSTLAHDKTRPWREIALTSLRRLQKRLGRLLLFTIPVYCLFFAIQQIGWFTAMEHWLANQAGWLSFLNPQGIGIVILYLASESGAALSAAASLMNAGAITTQEIILALMVGNILSSPLRALRHQFPSYAGYFPPGLALHLVLMNQFCRAISLAVITVAYYISIGALGHFP